MTMTMTLPAGLATHPAVMVNLLHPVYPRHYQRMSERLARAAPPLRRCLPEGRRHCQ